MNTDPSETDDDDEWYDDEDRNRYFSTGPVLSEEARFEEEDEDPLSLSDIMEKDLDEDHLDDILRKTRKVTSQNRR